MRDAPGWTRLIEPLLGYVDTHPGCGFAELHRFVGGTPSILTRALQELRYRELIRLERKPTARYYRGGPLVRMAGPVTVGLYAPLTPAERRSTEEKLGYLHRALGMSMPPDLLWHVLEHAERLFRGLQPQVAANDPLASQLLAAVSKIGLIRNDRFRT